MAKNALLYLLAQVIVAVAGSSKSTQSQGARCCQALYQTSLKNQVIFPNTTSFEDRIEHIWSVTAALPPWCFVLPESTEDTSLIIQTLTQSECPFGIVGGGHGDFAGSNSVKDGVTIDFGYLNATTYDADRKIASIGPGSAWQAVYETLQPLGVAVTGGRAGGVGTGGFITGGGNSFFSTSHGWACDNVQNFEVVLANGTVVNANIDENNDLWQALKGGSGNLGLVTRFDINHEDKNSSTMLYWVYNHAEETILQVAMDNTLNVEYPPIFDGFLNVSGIISSTLRSTPMNEITAEFDAGEPSGLRNIWMSGSYMNDARVIKYAAEQHELIIAGELAAVVSNDSKLATLCSFFPLTQAMIQHGIANGGNSMGLEEMSQGQNGALFLASLAINGAENEALAFPLVKKWVDAVDDYATSLDINWGWRFLNYAHLFQDPIASYGNATAEKIRAASDKYDPAKVFQNLRSSGHKIPSV